MYVGPSLEILFTDTIPNRALTKDKSEQKIEEVFVFESKKPMLILFDKMENIFFCNKSQETIGNHMF